MTRVSIPGRRNAYVLIAAGSLAIYLSLAISNSLAKRPWCDEAWFANPALNLMTTGSMGSPVIEPTGSCVTGRKPGVVLEGINQHTYWIMPLHVLAQAAWYRVTGFSLFSLRLLSVLWGLVALASWFLIVKYLSADYRVAMLAVLFIAVDYAFVSSASFGRMDMMNAALGFAGFAAYLALRAKRLNLAVMASHSLVAASVFTHPNGVLPFLGLVFLTIYFDRKRLAWRHAAGAVLPYLVLAGGWTLYILQSPSDFVSQIGANASGRWAGGASLFPFVNEVKNRYLANFYSPSYSSGVAGLRVLIPLAYFAALIAAAFTSKIRGAKGPRALLLLALIYFVAMSFFEGMKSFFYLVHITPIFASLLAVMVSHWWRERLLPAPLVAGGVCSLLALQVTWAINTAIKNSYQTKYVAAMEVLKQNSLPSSLIMGSADVGFALKFPENLTDDTTLGYTTGKKPDFIVVEDIYYQQSFRGFASRQPELFEYVSRLLTEQYRPIYNEESFKIYKRADAEALSLNDSSSIGACLTTPEQQALD